MQLADPSMHILMPRFEERALRTLFHVLVAIEIAVRTVEFWEAESSITSITV